MMVVLWLVVVTWWVFPCNACDVILVACCNVVGDTHVMRGVMLSRFCSSSFLLVLTIYIVSILYSAGPMCIRRLLDGRCLCYVCVGGIYTLGSPASSYI